MARCFPLVVALSLVGCAAEEPAEELGRRAAGLTPVAWTDLVGVSAAINDLTKTAPESAWNAGAVSVQALAGDGLVEFTAGESTTDKAIGLSVGNGGEKMSDIDFAIRLNASGRAIVYEGGESRGGIGTYAPGVVFRVQAEDGVVTYWRNGVLRYTSELAPTFPLLVDTSLRTPGATLRNVRIEPIDFWTAGVGVDIDRRDIVKTASEDQFNAGAASLGSIPSGDGYVEFRAADETSIVAAGLSRGNNNQSRTDIDFAIQPNHGTIAIYERGVLVDTFGPYRAGDLFQVEVSAGQVRYYHDRVLLHTSAQAPSYPLLLDASIRTPGASILGAKLVAGYTADGCIPVQQTLSEAARQADAEGDVLVLAESEAVPPVAKVRIMSFV